MKGSMRKGTGITDEGRSISYQNLRLYVKDGITEYIYL
jgi:hypothetical protein